MHEPSRRSLLSSSAAFALGLAGCLGQAAPATDRDEHATDDTGGPDQLPDALDRAFEYVYGNGDGAIVRIARHDGSGSDDRMGIHPTLDGVGDPAWLLYVRAGTSAPESGGLVATGSFAVEGDQYTADGSRAGFDRYRLDADGSDSRERVLLTDGQTILVGQPNWIDATLSQHESGADPYLESTPGARVLLGYAALERQTVLVNDAQAIGEPFQGVDVDESAIPSVLVVEYGRTDETVSYTIGGWFAETPGAEDAETLSAFLQSQLSMDDPTVEIHEGDQIVLARGSRAYTPPEERPDTASGLRFVEYDENTGSVLFRIEDGDQLPVDRYKIEIDETVYDGDWARGQSEVGEGDVIAIDADAIEPRDHLTVEYESPDGGYGSSSGMPGLRHLPFAVDYDPDERTAAVTYVEGPPLPADRVSVVIGDDERSEQPWDGDLTEGDSATLADLPIDEHLVVEYERSDGETVPIGHGSLRPPGEFDFAYDAGAETLTVAYPDREAEAGDRPPGAVRSATRRDQEPLVADRYVLRVDGERADRQFGDAGVRIEPGDSLTLEGVPVDTPVSVAWVDEGGDLHEIAGSHTIPDVSFAFGYDREADELTVSHDRGPAIDPGPIALRLREQGEERTLDWAADGALAEGEEFVVEDVGEDVFVVVTYRDRHLDHVHVREIIQAE